MLDEKLDFSGLFMFNSIVLKVDQDEFEKYWFTATELMSWKGMKPTDVGGPSRIVMSETHFKALRALLPNPRLKKARIEFRYLMSAYNVMLREFVSQARMNIRSDCGGCMRSEPDDMYICGRSSSLCIEMILHVCLKKKRIANRNKGLDFLYENISHLFPTIAKRLKEEMYDEEYLMNNFSGGIPEYVKHFKGDERKFPLADSMDYDV